MAPLLDIWNSLIRSGLLTVVLCCYATTALLGAPPSSGPAVGAGEIPLGHPQTFSSPPSPNLPAWNAYQQRMQRWRDAKFGIMLNWGLYTIPSGIWKNKAYPVRQDAIMREALISQVDYAGLAREFRPQKFQPDQWMSLIKDSGARYVLATAKHFDGFCMYNAAQTDFDVVAATPFKQDILQRIVVAARQAGLMVGANYSIADWHRINSSGANLAPLYPMVEAQVRELMSPDRDLDILRVSGEFAGGWNDTLATTLGRSIQDLRSRLLVSHGGTMQPDPGDLMSPFVEIPSAGIPGLFWEDYGTVLKFGKVASSEADAMPVKDLIRHLASVVSRGGNLLLGVCPTADGEIPAPVVQRLQTMGAWLRVNGESIYGTEPVDLRRQFWGLVTSKPGTLYLHVHEWPEVAAGGNATLVLNGLKNPARSAYLLSDPQQTPLKFAFVDEELQIILPPRPPRELDAFGCVVVLKFDGPLITTEGSTERVTEERIRYLVRNAFRAIGGPEKIPQRFLLQEEYQLYGNLNRTFRRTTALDLPEHWWVERFDRGASLSNREREKRFLVWAWTLGALTSQEVFLHWIPGRVLEGRMTVGVQLRSEDFHPIDLYFDAGTGHLRAMSWQAIDFYFNDWRSIAGAVYPLECVYFRDQNIEHGRTKITSLTRVSKIPAGFLAK